MPLAVQCELCPRMCRLEPGQAGDCRIRVNVDGRLVALTHGFPAALHVDPMEKKPLFHFLPGARVFSLATVGCNLHCLHCQNWELSQAAPDEVPAYDLPPEGVAMVALRERCPAVAYTYSEPLVYYEYTRDSSRACRAEGIRNVLVTAGYINPEPMRALCADIDAAIIDVKAMSDRVYRETCGGTLQPVLDTLRIAHEEGVWVEVLNLVIPTVNDDPAMIDDLVLFVRDELGPGVPLHFTAFHPDYKLRNLPRTPRRTLLDARERARAAGLFHVYVGNVEGGEAECTFCPGCGARLIDRVGYRITANRLVDGACPDCGRPLEGVFA